MSPRIVLFTLLLFIPGLSSASVKDYAAQRKQILESAPEERRDVIKTHSFDTSTVLGKYFYLSSFLYLENDPAFYALSQSELEELRRDYPQYYYEREVLMTWLSDLPKEERFEKFKVIQSVTRKNNWPRIEGWATSLLVSSLQASELHFNAIFEINEYTSRAPHTETAGMTYSYPLVAILYDMTTSLYWLNDHESTIKYCRRLKNYIPDDVTIQFDGLSCEASALLALQRLDEVQLKIRELNRLAEKTGLVESRVQVLILSAAYYRDQGRYDLMSMYAKDALELSLKTDSSLSPTVYGIYQLLTSSQIALKNVEQAQFYLNKMREVPVTTQTTGPVPDAYDFTAQARIYGLKGEYKKATEFYEKAVSALNLKESSNFSFRQLTSVNDSIDSRELKLTRQQLHEKTQYARIVSIIAVIVMILATISSLMLWRLLRRKRDLERFSRLDSLTSVYNRWFAIDSITKRLNNMKSLDDKVCVVLIDLDYFKRINDLFGHQTGDAVLSHFARLCKYQFSDEDIFGRYGGEEFVLMLNGAAQVDATTKLQALRHILAHQDLAQLGAEGSLEFSAGIVEVREKADITQVLSQCDKLLYTAKHNGRNQNICAIFAASEQADIV